jgi:pyruvate,water dikinase
MLTGLSDALQGSSGGKAAALGALLRKGLPVPDGFVVPIGDHPAAVDYSLHDAVAQQLERLGDPVVAVRSSSANEDTDDASAAGQYESVIGVRGTDAVCQAIVACRASAHAARVDDYWRQRGGVAVFGTGMAVLVQPVIEADTSGIMFTPQHPGEATRIEASWGLGLTVVGGTVTPDAYEITPNRAIDCSVGSKQIRIDLDHDHAGVINSTVPPEQRSTRTLDNATVVDLARLGEQIATSFGSPQDIEWAIANGVIWILQARPITAALPSGKPPDPTDPATALTGTPGCHGTVTAAARVVRGPSDFATVRRGDIVVCPYTDPSWTPLFTIAAGVITETGGALSHAAIVAREYGIPAVLGVPHATTRIGNGAHITLDGTAGTIAVISSETSRERRTGASRECS